MNRFYLPPDKTNDSHLVLIGGEAHHALNVLRIRPGEKVLVLNGAGQQISCTVESHTRNEARLAVVERKYADRPPHLITLFQAIPKGKLLEEIIQKATELGVHRIIPLISERSLFRAPDKEMHQKAEKWRHIAIEAVKQCGGAWLPKVEFPITIPAQLERMELFDLPLVASLQSGSQHPREYFRKFYARENRVPASSCIWIGPEGDFTAAEIERITSSGALPITLGPLVLRVLTAAMYCVSIINYEVTGVEPVREMKFQSVQDA